VGDEPSTVRTIDFKENMNATTPRSKKKWSKPKSKLCRKGPQHLGPSGAKATVLDAIRVNVVFRSSFKKPAPISETGKHGQGGTRVKGGKFSRGEGRRLLSKERSSKTRIGR